MKKIGIALGGGSARGLAHIGVLQVLHKNGIIPDYVAGTSMGAAIGAVYTAGRSWVEMKRMATDTNWKSIVDFTIPKAGLIQGTMVESRIREMVFEKQFKDLTPKLNIVAFNLDKREKVIFHEGDVASAVRASISIPGIFAPLEIDSNRYIDGGVVDPTPFDVVRQMGADIVIAVDLSREEGRVRRHGGRKSKLMVQLRKKLVITELTNLKLILFPERWPRFIRKLFERIFDKLLYPAKVIRMLFGQELFPVTRTLYETIQILSDNLARSKIACGKVDVLVRPKFGKLRWYDFDKVEEYVKIGERAMEDKMAELKKAMRR
jgi:NTE family protein